MPFTSSSYCVSVIAGRETAGGTMHDDSPCHSPEPTLLSRASLCVAGLTEGFRNLVALHEQVQNN